MSKASTLHDLIMADIRESNARNDRRRNQRRDEVGLRAVRRMIKELFGRNKRMYRRDRVLRKLCDIQVKFMMEKVAK